MKIIKEKRWYFASSFILALKVLIATKIQRENGEYGKKYAGKSTKNIQIVFPKVREVGHTIGSGRVASIIE